MSCLGLIRAQVKGGSPGLVVMGGDSFQRSWVRIPAPYTGWTLFTFICSKNCTVCMQKTKLKDKEAGITHFLKRTQVKGLLANTTMMAPLLPRIRTNVCLLGRKYVEGVEGGHKE